MSDTPLTDLDRLLLLDAVYLAINHRGASPTGPSLLALARKLEGTDKQLIVRDHGERS